jgi:hypothetical protein
VLLITSVSTGGRDMKKPVRFPVTENHIKHTLRYMLDGMGIKKMSDLKLRGTEGVEGVSVAMAAGAYSAGGVSDTLVCYKGKFIAIESKRPGRRGEPNEGLSDLQLLFGNAIKESGGLFFKVDDQESIDAVREALETL